MSGALRLAGEQLRHHLERTRDRAVDRRLLVCGRPIEHGVNHQVLRARMPDAKPQAPEVGAEVRHHVTHSIVTPMAATEFEPNGARG